MKARHVNGRVSSGWGWGWDHGQTDELVLIEASEVILHHIIGEGLIHIGFFLLAAFSTSSSSLYLYIFFNFIRHAPECGIFVNKKQLN
jgi:hypothetical protein